MKEEIIFINNTNRRTKFIVCLQAHARLALLWLETTATAAASSEQRTRPKTKERENNKHKSEGEQSAEASENVEDNHKDLMFKFRNFYWLNGRHDLRLSQLILNEMIVLF